MEVYWIRHKTHNNRFTQGYIGVSKDSTSRWKQHKTKTNQHLTNAFNKYTEDIVFEVLFEDIEEELALLIELEYRPAENIGWNIAKGGGLPPVGNKHTEESKEKIRQSQIGTNNSIAHPVNIYEYKTDKLIASNVCLKPWCRDNGYDSRNMGKTLKADRSKPSGRGNNHHTKGLYARYCEDV